MALRVGVLALQGGFAEHIAHLKKAAAMLATDKTVEVVEVRTADELRCCSALVIPGGESTCMAHIATTNNFLDPLREFCEKHPVWGTCAGMIFLAKAIQGGKKGGQVLIGNMDITVNRNFFGNQVHSFETSMSVPSGFADLSSNKQGSSDEDTFRAVFIRAPAILLEEEQMQKKKKEQQNVEYLSVLHLDEPVELSDSTKVTKVAVAAKQNHILVTAFHPELTSDVRWHALFVKMALQHYEKNPKKEEMKAFPKAPLPLAERFDLPALC